MPGSKKIIPSNRVTKVAQLLTNGLLRYLELEKETRENTCNSGQPERSWSKTEMENK